MQISSCGWGAVVHHRSSRRDACFFRLVRPHHGKRRIGRIERPRADGLQGINLTSVLLYWLCPANSSWHSLSLSLSGLSSAAHLPWGIPFSRSAIKKWWRCALSHCMHAWASPPTDIARQQHHHKTNLHNAPRSSFTQQPFRPSRLLLFLDHAI